MVEMNHGPNSSGHPMAGEDVPIACSLSATAAAGQVAAWAQLAGSCLEVAPDGPGRFRARFPAVVEADLRAVAEVEQACCPFLDIDITAEGEQVVLTIGAANPDAYPIVETLRGAVATSRCGPGPGGCGCCSEPALQATTEPAGGH